MKLKIKKLHPDAVIPHYATDGAAGLDLTCTEWEAFDTTFENEDECRTIRNVKCYTGLAFEIPKGYVGLLFPRSSVFKHGLTMANCVGVIDSDYRGEVTAIFYTGMAATTYVKGERCCQLVIVKLPEVEIEEVDELSETARGTGGYGSTGK